MNANQSNVRRTASPSSSLSRILEQSTNQSLNDQKIAKNLKPPGVCALNDWACAMRNFLTQQIGCVFLLRREPSRQLHDIRVLVFCLVTSVTLFQCDGLPLWHDPYVTCSLSDMHTCMHTCMHACTHTCMHACMHACMHTCRHTCRHACTQTYMQTYTQTAKQKLHRHHTYSLEAVRTIWAPVKSKWSIMTHRVILHHCGMLLANALRTIPHLCPIPSYFKSR